MIDFLKEWVLTIAGVTVFGSVCDIIIPGGNFKKYIHLAIGLVLIMTMLIPIQNIFLKANSFRLQTENFDYEKKYAQVKSDQQKEIIKLYKEKLCNKIRATLEKVNINTILAIECDIEENQESFGNIKTLKITIKGNNNSSEENLIKSEINKIYSIDLEKIIVQYKGVLKNDS